MADHSTLKDLYSPFIPNLTLYKAKVIFTPKKNKAKVIELEKKTIVFSLFPLKIEMQAE